MQIQVELGIEQLVSIIKQLPVEQLERLRAAFDGRFHRETANNELEKILMNGPVATEAELEIIAQNRKDLEQWRSN